MTISVHQMNEGRKPYAKCILIDTAERVIMVIKSSNRVVDWLRVSS